MSGKPYALIRHSHSSVFSIFWLKVKDCDWNRHIQESGGLWAEIPKKSQKGVPEPPGPECQKTVEKVPNDPKKSQKDY